MGESTVLLNIAIKIVGTLTPFVVGGIAGIRSAKKELESLMKDIGIIRGVLSDAEQRQHGSQAVKEWLKIVKDVIYDVDDLVELIATDAKMQELKATDNKWSNKVRNCFSKSNPLILNHRLAKNVIDLKARLDKVISEMAAFNFVVRDVNENVVAFHKKRERTCGFIDTEEIIGRDQDKRKIMEMLMDGEESLSVIPIVGIGGLGKTALAQLIYNDKIVNKHFDVRIWLCVSEDFDVHSIVKKIVSSIDGKVAVDKLSLDELLCHVQQNLKAKRYLLFLDDIWNENREKWLKLKSVLPLCGKGSRVVITTRSKTVADIMGTVPLYELKGLSEEKSWSLFTRVAFKPGQAVKTPEFVDIGSQIVKKCANVPLAIRTLGSLLYGKDTVREWMLIKDEELSKIEQAENHILPVLKISYMHLNSHLKHCFALCALFPKDSWLRKEYLINLWIAAGFIQQSDENRSLEDIGEDYFMLLLRRCFFQNVRRYNSGAVCSCKMHDLIHDLALSVAKEDAQCLRANATGHLCDGIRDASVSSGDPRLLVESKHLRALLSPNGLSSSILSGKLRVLRMLDLSYSMLDDVPSVIGEMKLLRYLYLMGNRFRELPDSLTGLLNLQLLDLESCYELEKLPRNFEKLINLRFLNISMTCMRSCEWNKIPFYRNLSHYKLTDVDSVILSGKSVDKAKVQLLMNRKMLFNSNIQRKTLEVLEIEDSVYDLILPWIDSAPATLTNLVKVKMEHCLCHYLPCLSLLPSLKFLVFRHMKSLQLIRNNRKASSSSEATSVSPFFPSLVELELHDLRYFQGWEYHHPKPSFPPLSKLRISKCPKLTALPQVTQVIKLEIDVVNQTILQMF